MTNSQAFEYLYSSRYYCIAVLLFAYFAITNYVSYRRLSHIKGPWFAAWSNLWLVGVVWRRKINLELYEVYKTYGSLARIGPNDLVTTDIDLLHRMSAAGSPYTRSDFFLAFRLAPGIDNVFSMRDEKLHTKRKAQLQMAYTGKENIGLEASVDVQVKNFIDLVRRKYVSTAEETKPMDLASKAQFFTLDVITYVATGASFGDLLHDEDRFEYLQATANSMPAMTMAGCVPASMKLLQIPWIGKAVYPSATEEKGMGRLVGFTQKMVAERFSPDAKRRVSKLDMLGSFINRGLTEEEAVSESLLQILAASDTSATAIRAIMLFIMTSPLVYNKLRAEIDLFATSCKPETIISDSQARELPYLQAVIREGLRIFPAGPGTMPKVVPPEGDTINGVFVPGGTNIGHNVWSFMRSTETWGEDATVFRPERWLEASPEKKGQMERVGDLLFGYGKYKCLGVNVAMMELNKVFFELMRNFDWTLIDPLHPWNSDCLGLWIQRDLYVRVTDRLRKEKEPTTAAEESESLKAG